MADAGNYRIRKIIISTKVGNTLILARSGTEEEFEFTPHGIAVDSSDNLYVADTANHLIRKITSAGVGSALTGSGTEAQFYSPEGVPVDSSGNIYVADTNNHRIRKIEYK